MNSLRSLTIKQDEFMNKDSLKHTNKKKIRKCKSLTKSWGFIENSKKLSKNLESFEIIDFVKKNLKNNLLKYEYQTKKLKTSLMIFSNISIGNETNDNFIHKNTDNMVESIFSSNLVREEKKKICTEKLNEGRFYFKSGLNENQNEFISHLISEGVQNSHYPLKLLDDLKLDKNEEKRILKRFKKLVYDSYSEEEVDNEIKVKWLILHDNPLKHDWDILMSLFIIYYSIYYPVQLSFFMNGNRVIFIIDLIIDMLFLIDIFLTFLSSYLDQYDRLISSHSEIALYYCGTWFAIDLFTSLPYNLFTLNITNSWENYNFNGKMLNWLRVLRSLKLESQKFSNLNFSLKIFPNNNPRNGRLLHFTIFLFIIAHIFSCFYIFLGKYNDSMNNWITNFNFQDKSPAEIYVDSIYYIFASIFTIGYGDICPMNTSERIFTIFVLTIGCAIFSYALSSISHILGSSNNKEIILEKKQKIFKEISNDYKIPYSLEKQIRRSFKNYYDNTDDHIMSILKILPSSTRNLLFIKMYERQIQKLKFFENKSYEFIISTVPLLKTAHFVKNDILISYGDFIHEIYMLYKGIIKIRMSEEFDKFIIGAIYPGNNFGELIMYTNEQSNFNYIVKSKLATVMILKKSDFANLKMEFRNEINQILTRSIENFNEIERREKYVIDNYYRKIKSPNIRSKLRMFGHEFPSVSNKIKENLDIERDLTQRITKLHRSINPMLFKVNIPNSTQNKWNKLNTEEIKEEKEVSIIDEKHDNHKIKGSVQIPAEDLTNDKEMNVILEEVKEIEERIAEINEFELNLKGRSICKFQNNENNNQNISPHIKESQKKIKLQKLEDAMKLTNLSERRKNIYISLSNLVYDFRDLNEFDSYIKSKILEENVRNYEISVFESLINSSDSDEYSENDKKENRLCGNSSNLSKINQRSEIQKKSFFFQTLKNNFLSLNEKELKLNFANSSQDVNSKQSFKNKKIHGKHNSFNVNPIHSLEKNKKTINSPIPKYFHTPPQKFFKNVISKRKKSLFERNNQNISSSKKQNLDRMSKKIDLTKTSEKKAFIKKLGEDIEIEGFLNKNESLMGDYLKEFIESRKNSRKSVKTPNNEFLKLNYKLDNVFKKIKKIS